MQQRAFSKGSLDLKTLRFSFTSLSPCRLDMADMMYQGDLRAARPSSRCDSETPVRSVRALAYKRRSHRKISTRSSAPGKLCPNLCSMDCDRAEDIH